MATITLSGKEWMRKLCSLLKINEKTFKKALQKVNNKRNLVSSSAHDKHWRAHMRPRDEMKELVKLSAVQLFKDGATDIAWDEDTHSFEAMLNDKEFFQARIAKKMALF